MAQELEMGIDGMFSLCVFGAEDCPDEEIHEIFGKFGEVNRINRSGDKVFVRYPSLEEATHCFKSMMGDTKFRVRPGRSKKAAQNNPGGFKDSKFGEMNRNDNFRGQRRDTGGSGDFGRPGTNGFQPAAARSRQPPPKLIPFPSGAAKEAGASKPQQAAKVVVIANLHPKMGQNNIYELCTKAKAPPLHVAMKTIKRPPYPNMYYVYVYVKNDEAVEKIQISLNSLKLNGYKLIVSEAMKLRDEGNVLRGK